MSKQIANQTDVWICSYWRSIKQNEKFDDVYKTLHVVAVANKTRIEKQAVASAQKRRQS